MRRAVLICPGRGTYGKAELGYLARHHSGKSALLSGFDAQRKAAGQPGISTLDAAQKYASSYLRGDVASGLIYACSVADAQDLAEDIEIVAVTGNSMGWYTSLALAGAVSLGDGFHVVNTMGTLMQDHLIGGQMIYPFMAEDWQNDPGEKSRLLEQVAEIDQRSDHTLALSIDLGGMLVLAGNAKGLAAAEASLEPRQGRFPMRLANHAAFHTVLQAPVAAEGRARLHRDLFQQPDLPMVDGRGQIWWPGACDVTELWRYTFDHQVVRPYDFTKAITASAREFAPDLFVITGPGKTLGGAVAQSLIIAEWQGLSCKADLKISPPALTSMGDPDQRGEVT